MTNYHTFDNFDTTSMNTSASKGGFEEIRYPGKHDVLFGRGGAINQHIGNIMFRKIVDEQKEDYFKAVKSDKPQIAWRVVNIIRNLDPPGRFLAPIRESDKNSKLDDGSILWQDVGDKKARAKASQCLREKKVECYNVSYRSHSDSLNILREDPTSYHFESNNSISSVERKMNKSSSVGAPPSNIDYTVMKQDQVIHCDNDERITKRISVKAGTKNGYNHDPWYYYQATTSTVQLVTPCHDYNTSQHNNLIDKSREIGGNNRDFHIASDLSWVRSFCSVETHMIEESDSMSLSPPIQQRLLCREDQNHDPVFLHSTSWASSDVRSELTDSSYTEELNELF